VWLQPLIEGKAVAARYVRLQPAGRWDGQRPQELVLPNAEAAEPCKHAGGTPAKKRRRTAPVRLGMEGDASRHWGECLRAACVGLGLPPPADVSLTAEQPRRDVRPCSSLFDLHASKLVIYVGHSCLQTSENERLGSGNVWYCNV
jgi:hypothetical protein